MPGILVIMQAGHRLSEETLVAAQSLGPCTAAITDAFISR